MMKYSAIILAAGSGTRTGLDYNKILAKINNKKVIDYSFDFFSNHDKCSEIIIVSSDCDFNYLYDRYEGENVFVIIGGNTRQESVYKGLNKANSDYVLIHDSARPFINSTCVDNLLSNLVETNASTLAVPVTDSVVRSSGNRLGKQLNRNELLAIQTPQGFLRELIVSAHDKAIKAKYIATDDTDLIAKFTDVTPSYVMGDYRSIKLTTRLDIKLLEVIL